MGVSNGIYDMFRYVRTNDKITRRMKEDRENLDLLLDTNFVQYGAHRKKNLFNGTKQKAYHLINNEHELRAVVQSVTKT